MVMLSHMIGSFVGWTPVRPFSGAYLCVIYFFIMSGFVLSYAHSSGSFFKYLLTRLARLWPLHFISAVLMVLVYYYNARSGGYVPSEEVFSLVNFLKNILFLHGIYWYKFQLINEPSWSISLEFWCSLLIPLIFIKLGVLVRFVIAVVIFVFMWGYYSSGVPASMLTAALSMLVGSLCFSLAQTAAFSRIMKEKFSALFITVSAVACIIGVYALNHSRLDYFLFLVFIPVLFIDYLEDEQLIKKVFTSSVFLFLGYISFPLYLLHELIIVSGFIFDPQNGWTSVSIAAAAAIFIAYIYARFIDYPLYRLLKRFIAKVG
ncbi:acyltransferase [Klebsiella sp. RHBSTW-00215]|nr:acyltransferase [Klebsiella sp. RHBSTW-00215]